MSVAFHSLQILDVAREAEDAIVLTLKPEVAQANAFRFLPGQHLTLRALIGGEDVRRNYSICVPPSSDTLKVAVKKVDGGVFSSWAVESLQAGGMIEAMAPRGHFTWTFEPGQVRSYIGFASGSGITPILSLIETGLLTEPDSRFTLLYGNRTSNSIMFLERLADLKDRFLHRFQVYHFLTREFDDVELFNGRLDEPRIAEVLSGLVDPTRVDVAFICGPGEMVDVAEKALIDAGLDPTQVLVERFTAAKRPEGADRIVQKTRARGLQLEVTLEGRRRIIDFQAEAGSVLDSARAAGLPAPYACKAGVCATCRAKLVRGQVSMDANYGLSADEVQQGYVLTCQAIPLTDDVILDYDA